MGVEYLHSQNIIHGNIMPYNVYIDHTEGFVFLFDF